MTGSPLRLPVMGAALDPRVLVTWCATVGTAWHCRLEGAPRELLVGARSSGPLWACSWGHASARIRVRAHTCARTLAPWPLSGFPAFRLLGVDARLARPLADVVCGKIARVGVLHQLLFAVLAGDALPLGVVVGVVVIVVRLFARERDDRSQDACVCGLELLYAGDDIVARAFRADAPNKLWLTDVTQFQIPAGKAYLSPVIDCFDGMPVAWTIRERPNAEMANTMLEEACETLGPGEAPVIHSDRGCHYRWPGWIEICERHGLARSMSKKGCSPDNSAMEGFFGQIKDTDNGNRAIDEGYRRKCARADAMAH